MRETLVSTSGPRRGPRGQIPALQEHAPGGTSRGAAAGRRHGHVTEQEGSTFLSLSQTFQRLDDQLLGAGGAASGREGGGGGGGHRGGVRVRACAGFALAREDAAERDSETTALALSLFTLHFSFSSARRRFLAPPRHVPAHVLPSRRDGRHHAGAERRGRAQVRKGERV